MCSSRSLKASFTQTSTIGAGEDPQLLSARQGLSTLKSKLYVLLGWHTPVPHVRVTGLSEYVQEPFL